MRSLSWFLAVALAGCSAQPFQYLTRPGAGTTGSVEETTAYYAAFTDHPAEPTLTEWLAQRCFFLPGTTSYNPATTYSAFYYNGSDLGLGREMRCADCSKDRTAADPQLISCVVSNHGVPQGLDLIQFGQDQRSSISTALTQLEEFLAGKRPTRGASVAMDFHPKRVDKVRFYIYDASEPTLFSPGNHTPEALIPGLQLDGEGLEFNKGVKYIRNCLACHGGRYDADSNRILGSVFLDFDVSLFTFSDDPVFGSAPGTAKRATASAENLENLRQLNHLVRGIAEKTGHPEIVGRIDGSYDAGGVADPRSKYVGGYVPAGWPDSQVVRQFDGKNITAKSYFQSVVHRYCSTCHFSQSAGNNVTQIDANKPLTFANWEHWFKNDNFKDGPDGLDVIHRDVCGAAAMPHAQVTRMNLLRDSTALSLICN